MNSKLFVSNDVSINGNLGISKNIVGQGTATVTGLTSLNEKLFVTGDVSLNSKLFVSNDVSINGNLGISKNIISQGTLTMTGLTSLNEKLFVTGDASLNSKLFVSADSSLNGNLAVSKNIIGQGTLTVTGNTSLNSRLTVTGETTMNSGLGVALDSSFNQKLFVAGNLTVGTSATTYVGIGMDPSSNYRMNVSGIVNATGGVLNNGTVVDGPTGILSNDVYENYCSAFSLINGNYVDANSDTKEINRVAISSDGKYITAVGDSQGYPVVSSDYGKTFQEIIIGYSQSAGPQNVEMSANGKFQYYVSAGISVLLRSSNYGITWTSLLDDSFRDVAVSSSGQYVIVTKNEYSMLSNDYGVTFTTIPGFATNLVLRNNAISSSGQIIVLSYFSGVYVSTNFGISWKQIVLSFQNNHLSMSSTGQYIIVVGSTSARIYISSDYGATFVQNTVLNDLGISPTYSFVSSNGQYQIISHTGGMVSSVDYGKTWVPNTIYNYRGIAMTSNGRIVVSATDSGIVMSTNYSTEFADRFKLDVSLNARLRVALDSSFNGNLFINGSIVNTGLSNSLNLKAPLAAPSFTGLIVSAGDVSLNANLAVGGILRSNNIIPMGNLVSNIGSPTNWFGNLYVSHIESGSNSISIGGALITSQDGSIAFGDSVIDGSFIVNGDVSFNSGLKVGSDSSFNSNLYVGGSIVNSALTTALGLKAPLASPSLTGVPVAPTASQGTNTTQLATTAYVRSEISALVASAPETLDTLNELAAALGNDAAFSTTVTNSIGLKAPSASPSFTGTFLVSSADASFNGNVYVEGAINNTGLTSALALKAPLASPSFTGVVISAGDVSLNAGLRVASDSSFNSNLYVGGSIVNSALTTALGLKAPLASPTFTGNFIVSSADASFNGNLFVNGAIKASSVLTVTGGFISNGSSQMNHDFLIQQSTYPPTSTSAIGYTVTAISSEFTFTANTLGSVQSFTLPSKGVWLVITNLSHRTTGDAGTVNNRRILIATTNSSNTPVGTALYYEELDDVVGSNGIRMTETIQTVIVATASTTYYVNGLFGISGVTILATATTSFTRIG